MRPSQKFGETTEQLGVHLPTPFLDTSTAHTKKLEEKQGYSYKQLTTNGNKIILKNP